ncbi:MAG TPA: hypothetical protein PLU11_11510, partial [Chitinophagaceae bacterium]|nr:hypothetical protein [Chitinophagaceae bacterium]
MGGKEEAVQIKWGIGSGNANGSINYQIVDYLREMFNIQFSMLNKQQARLLTANCQLPTANCQLPTANCRLPTANCRLP